MMKHHLFRIRCLMRMLGLLLLIAFASGAANRAGSEIPTVVSESASYDMQSTAEITRVGSGVQEGGLYEIVPVINWANNGLAIGSGTKLIINWPAGGPAENGAGFDVHSSTSGRPGTFLKINERPVPVPPYEMECRRNGNYYFIIYRISLFGVPVQWTEMFVGRMTEFNPAGDWMFYE